MMKFSCTKREHTSIRNIPLRRLFFTTYITALQLVILGMKKPYDEQGGIFLGGDESWCKELHYVVWYLLNKQGWEH